MMARRKAATKVRAAAPDIDLAADRERALALVPVSRETAARLDRFVGLLLEWQAKTNLIASSTVAEIWTRHVADSLQLLALAPQAKVWVDFGTGAGFPGLVIACALADESDATVYLVESNQKKAAFLREAVRLTGATAKVQARRIEEFVIADRVDVVTARALAPLKNVLALAETLLKTGAVGLFLKGQDVEAELTEASKYWTIAATLVPSKTSQAGRVVVIRKAQRR
jgi:16S rRNA (guanine527-N7)-methyltransferase